MNKFVWNFSDFIYFLYKSFKNGVHKKLLSSNPFPFLSQNGHKKNFPLTHRVRTLAPRHPSSVDFRIILNFKLEISNIVNILFLSFLNCENSNCKFIKLKNFQFNQIKLIEFLTYCKFFKFKFHNMHKFSQFLKISKIKKLRKK